MVIVSRSYHGNRHILTQIMTSVFSSTDYVAPKTLRLSVSGIYHDVLNAYYGAVFTRSVSADAFGSVQNPSDFDADADAEAWCECCN